MKGDRYFIVDLNKIGKGWVLGKLSEKGGLELLFDPRFPKSESEEAADSLLLHVDGLVMSSRWPWEEVTGEGARELWRRAYPTAAVIGSAE